MRNRWKSFLSKVLIATVALQASLFNVVLGTGTAHAAEAPVLINEISPSGDWIELFASRDVNFDDEEGWNLLTSAGTTIPLSGTLTPGQFWVVELDNNTLDDDNDWVKLTHGSYDADVVRWGVGFATHVPGISGLKTIARTVDGAGRWIANVSDTEGESNATEMDDLPPVPSILEIAETDDNPLNTINATTQEDVTIRGSFAGEAELATALTGSNGVSTDIEDAVGDDLDAGEVDNIDASELPDGSIAVRAYTEVGSKRSAWVTTSAWKDTVAPNDPENASVLAGKMNGTNVINMHNNADVRVGADVDEDAAYFNAKLEDADALLVSDKLPTDGSQGLDATTLADGDVTLRLQAIDAAWNTSEWSSSVVGKDTIAAAAISDLRAHEASGYVSLSWNGSSSSDIGSYRVYSDGATGFLQSDPLAEIPAGTNEFTSSLLPNGTNLFRINAVDRFGNEEPSGESVSVEVSGALEKATLSANDRTLDLIDPLRLLVRVSPDMTDEAQLSVTNNSRSNPTAASLPSGHSAVGKYFELVTNNDTVFPLEIRIYYTAKDLAEAGVADESQLEGIRYYDASTGSWQLYSTSGVSTADVTFGSLDFDGYVWAFANHLTPIVASADIAAPDMPANLRGEAGDGLVKLDWDQSQHSAGYMIRYRQATNDDNLAYETVSVAGGDVTTATLKGFENDVIYEFGVASNDWVGNTSDYAVIEQTPTTAGSTADFVLPSKTASKPVPSGNAALSSDAVGGSVDGDETGTTNETDSDATDSDVAIGGSSDGDGGGDGEEAAEDGEVKGGADEQADSANTRTLVTILIIVIAAAAGFGGYYGYQWWMTKPESSTQDSSTPEPKKKSNRTERSGRW